MNTMLAGLCNLCDDYGHSNFESVHLLLVDLKKVGVLPAAAHSGFVSATRQYQKFLKVEFPKEVRRNKAQYCHHMENVEFAVRGENNEIFNWSVTD